MEEALSYTALPGRLESVCAGGARRGEPEGDPGYPDQTRPRVMLHAFHSTTDQCWRGAWVRISQPRRRNILGPPTSLLRWAFHGQVIMSNVALSSKEWAQNEEHRDQAP